MFDPSWLAVGTALADPDGERWFVHGVTYEHVRVEHPDRGVFRLRKNDLLRWVDRGEWTVVG